MNCRGDARVMHVAGSGDALVLYVGCRGDVSERQVYSEANAHITLKSVMGHAGTAGVGGGRGLWTCPGE